MRHAIYRTSPKGTPFVGVCRNCGREGLTFEDMEQECENILGRSEEETLVEAIAEQSQ